MDTIIKLIISPFWVLAELIIGLIPKSAIETIALNSTFLRVISVGLHVTGVAQFMKILSVFCFFATAQFILGIVEFIIRKIPGGFS